MTEDAKKQDQLLETTDCLEAIGTLKSNKNLFFFLCLLCLLLLQGCFWLLVAGHVNFGTNEQMDKLVQSVTIAPVSAPNFPVPPEPNIAKSEPNQSWHKYSDQLSVAKIDFSKLAWVIRICNYLLIIGSVIYSISLLFGLMISLVGRLGGISHVTKAFFISILMIVILLPWQILFKNVGIGAIFRPAELLASWQLYADANFVARTFIYLRYVGIPVVVILLLIWAQLKSMRWSRNTLKRLGIVG